MSWVTVIWSMIASACLTLAAIYWLTWSMNRKGWAHLLFALTAASTAVLAFFELRLMRAGTVPELVAALTWGQVPLFLWLVSLTWFVRLYLDAGRPWLAWTICALRALALVIALLVGPELASRGLTGLRQVQFLGESVTVIGAARSVVTPINQFASLLILVFVADAARTAWRRGDRRKAVVVGGSVEFALVASLGSAIAILWGDLQIPVVFSLFYMGLVAVMGYELSRDVLRASQLVRELQRSNQQISDLFGRLIAAQETERTRIARDLHDDVSQRIAGLSIMVSGIKGRLRIRPGDSESADALASVERNILALAEQIRGVSHDLHPSVLQHAGLVSALTQFCEEFGKLQVIAVTFTAGDNAGQIEGETAVCLYRVTQEALRNVARHAGARHVSVTLNRTTRAVQLSVSDDGRGFDLNGARREGSGLGLISMDERVRLLGGSVRIETGRHGGTTVHVDIPHA